MGAVSARCPVGVPGSHGCWGCGTNLLEEVDQKTSHQHRDTWLQSLLPAQLSKASVSKFHETETNVNKAHVNTGHESKAGVYKAKVLM